MSELVSTFIDIKFIRHFPSRRSNSNLEHCVSMSCHPILGRQNRSSDISCSQLATAFGLAISRILGGILLRRLESNQEGGFAVRIAFPKTFIPLIALIFAIGGQTASGQDGQTQPVPQHTDTSKTSAGQQPHQGSPGGDVGRGAGDIGKGTAKGAGAAAKGVGKGAGDLVTLHPVDAAGNVGKGAAVAGKDVGVGAAKGTGKIAKGTGRGIGKLFHHHHETQAEPAPREAQN
jgi:hypothetical protein